MLLHNLFDYCRLSFVSCWSSFSAVKHTSIGLTEKDSTSLCIIVVYKLFRITSDVDSVPQSVLLAGKEMRLVSNKTDPNSSTRFFNNLNFY